ncbi:hypothetical protein PGT21_023346 [Puccinia graminis f. sp. tritici]|uniref:Uncharacterized protein n=1 Tax=Puccinia graminis f. sp. tritici TaxID=56615 RepID=A0A5B0QX73_PUCGR|nr:hypothetical protein PGT21_023346 [Puccinia graminis f. sp. tritici]
MGPMGRPHSLPGGIPSWSTVQPCRPGGGDSLLIGGTTSPAQEGILLVGEVVRPRRPRRESSWSARSYNLVDQEGILLAGDNLAGQEDSLLGRRGCTVDQEAYNLVDQEGILLAGDNLAGQEDSLLGRRGCTVDQEGILLVDEAVQLCTTSSTRRIPSWSTIQPRRPRRESSWSARLYSLADQSLLAGDNLAGQEDSLLGRRGCTVDQEGILLVGEVVQPRRPGGSPPRRPGGFPPGPARLYRRPGGNPPGRRGCTTSPTRRIPS